MQRQAQPRIPESAANQVQRREKKTREKKNNKQVVGPKCSRSTEKKNFSFHFRKVGNFVYFFEIHVVLNDLAPPTSCDIISSFQYIVNS